MIELEDVGRDVLLTFAGVGGFHQAERRIIMVIKAPRGTLTLFDRGYASPDTQCAGIRAFMEQHSDDTLLCGAYAEHWKELDKPEGWRGCSLPKGHEGAHRDD